MSPSQAELYKRPRLFVFIPAVALCAFLLVAVIHYVVSSSQAAESVQPDLSGWEMALADGSPIAPDPAGGLDLPEGAILYLTADAPAFASGQAVASVRSKGVLYAFLVDGQPAADPFGLLGGSGGSQALPGGIYTFRCGAGSRLTIAVQFLTVPPSMENLPSVTLYDGVADYDSQNVHLGAFSSLLIGLFLTIAFLMLAIFLMQLWRGAPEWGSLLLAVTALAICLNRTILYADIMRNTLKDPGLYLIVRHVPLLAVLLLLWQHLEGRAKKILAVPALGGVGCMAGLLGYNLAVPERVTGAVYFMRWWLLPLVLFALLLAGAWQAVRAWRGKAHHGSWFCRFFITAGCSMAAMICLSVLSVVLYGPSKPAWAYTPLAVEGFTLFRPALRLSYLTAISSFVLATYDFIQMFLSQEQERQAIILQNRFATEHADALYRTLLETRSVRHEIRSRTETLRILCEEGDLARIKAYVEQFYASSQITPSLYSANQLVNALVAPRLQTAQDAGIHVDALIQVPESLPVSDIDLSTLLVNMLDNAVVAASAVPDPAERQLTLRMNLRGNRLRLFCRNSYTGELTLRKDGLPASKRGKWHGCGMELMRRVAKKYDGSLNVEHENGLFTLDIFLLLPFPHKDQPD